MVFRPTDKTTDEAAADQCRIVRVERSTASSIIRERNKLARLTSENPRVKAN